MFACEQTVGLRCAGQNEDQVIGLRQNGYEGVGGHHPVMTVEIIRRLDGGAFHSGQVTPEGFEDASDGLADAPEPQEGNPPLI